MLSWLPISIHPSDLTQVKEYAIYGVGSNERVMVDPRSGVHADGVVARPTITNWKARGEPRRHVLPFDIEFDWHFVSRPGQGGA